MSTASATALATLHKTDFADWLSPILVKELRQGLKTRMFVSVFVILQVVMIILVGLQLLSVSTGANGRSAMEAFDIFFWAVLWVPLLIIMPARGLTAVSEEVKANTLDLVQLTKLTAFRIVLGKWFALVAQTLLLVAAVLPYTVLRYFFGDVNIVGDMYTVGILLVSSLTLTAGAVALSSVHVVVRILVVLGGIPALMSFFGAMSFSRAITGTTPTFPEVTTLLVMILISSGIYILYFLEMAAGKIAPISENHSGRRRMISLATALIVPIAFLALEDDFAGPWMATFMPLWCWSVFEALCERTVPVPSLYQPFARRGFLGKLAGRFFYPGWSSGILFTAVLFISLSTFFIAAVAYNTPAEIDAETLAVTLPVIFTSIIFPVVVLLLFPRMKQPAWLYILVQALFGLLFIAALIVAEVPGGNDEETYRFLAPFPLSALFAMMADGFDYSLTSFFGLSTVPVCGVICLYLGFRMFREFKVIRQLEKESLGSYPQVQVSPEQKAQA